MTEEPTRKLAVLLHADVVGSTALVQKNETLAHQRMQDTFRRFSESITSHGGIAHEIRGDALVAEFAKASDAISASLAFQAANTDHNQELPDEVRPVLRVGIAIGEVVIADNTVTGEGVVLAQRLEQLAEPGGVCVQGAAHETVPKRLPFTYESLGERELKGFNEPVKAYAVRSRCEVGASEIERETTERSSENPGSDRPSIAVLPFTNMSGDPEQEYFSDGITEDIITELSRFPVLFVIARHSSFAFKGEKVNIQEIGKKLGVQYVVEGSVRKAGNRIRITAQLIEAATGNHIWAERYDRELEEVFSVQDEVTKSIVVVLPVRMEAHVADRASRKPTENMKAYELMLQGKSARDRQNVADTAQARRLLKMAIEIDPRYARAYAYLADTYVFDQLFGLAPADASSVSLQLARKAATLDPDDVVCKNILGWAYIGAGMWEDADAQFTKSLANGERGRADGLGRVCSCDARSTCRGAKRCAQGDEHGPYAPALL